MNNTDLDFINQPIRDTERKLVEDNIGLFSKTSTLMTGSFAGGKGENPQNDCFRNSSNF